MAEIGISLAEKLIEVVASKAITEICSIWGYESQLDDLKNTITTIRKVLLDAESKDHQLGHEARDYIQKLQDAVYDADDLFDEFLTLAKLKQHNKDGKLSKKVRNFFSSKNTLSVAYSMSRGVKKLRKKLDAIASNHNTFGFSADSQPIRERREETCSYVYTNEVIGRECDLSNVVHMLLDSGSQDSVSFLSVFGVGGLGKTTLAQLVFNDERIKSEFPLRLWACVSDDNGEEFDVKTILARILESASGDKHDGLTLDLVQRKLLGSMELLQMALRRVLGGKKYLIVLDDVWNEDREKWLGLRKFLMEGGVGSRVLVTTRSERTATVVDEKFVYELKGLSPENSWRLFEMTAFGETRRDNMNSSELIEIGKKIVEQCSNVPLAIKVVGTLLYGQKLTKWISFQKCGVAKIKDGDKKIMSILKLSYDNLESPLKTCFTYCALFPKDFRINKEKLIWLWMAQGYIVPFEVGQTLEDAGEEYFSILLRRCFFQDVEKNYTGEVKSFKIHDLMHDVAQKVAGKSVAAVHSIQTNLGDETHHLFHIGSKCKGSIFSKCKTRSYVRDGFRSNFPVAKLVENWTFLRTLDLHDLDIVSLPSSIGKLLHLRYLDLSDNRRLSALPDSITNLYNLQTLNLDECYDLKELPKDLAKLANLRHLYLNGCYSISAIPSGLDKLSGLCVLTRLELHNKGAMSGLEILRALKNLRGSITILIFKDVEVATASSEGYLRSKNLLVGLSIEFIACETHERLLEELEPPSSLTSLSVDSYWKATLPLSWYGPGNDNNWAAFLPNLVCVSFHGFFKLQNLPSMSKLLYLQTLSLGGMYELEYIEDFTHNGSDRPVFFPSLKTLKISKMKKLKGWWRGEDKDCDNCWQPFFSRLSVLEIEECPELRSFPACISLEKMTLKDVHKELRIMNLDDNSIKLKVVQLDNLDYLNLLPLEGVISLCIEGNHDIENLSELGKTFKSCLSIQSITISYCWSLRSLQGVGWEHLTALDSIQLRELACLNLETEEDGDDDNDDAMPWRSFGGRLRSLELSWFDIKTVPRGVRHLTSLENLTIEWCSSFKTLPEWITCLSSLRSLRIVDCEEFQLNPGILRDLTSLKMLLVLNCPLATERFQDPDGDDWDELRHIPYVEIRTVPI